DHPTTHLYTLPLHDALPISIHNIDNSCLKWRCHFVFNNFNSRLITNNSISHFQLFITTNIKTDSRVEFQCTSSRSSLWITKHNRSEEHTSELQSRFDLVCRL